MDNDYFYNEVYLPAESKKEKEIGRHLTLEEMVSLHTKIAFVGAKGKVKAKDKHKIK